MRAYTSWACARVCVRMHVWGLLDNGEVKVENVWMHRSSVLPKLDKFSSAAQTHFLTYTDPRTRGKIATLHCLDCLDCLVGRRVLAPAQVPARTHQASLAGQPHHPPQRTARLQKDRPCMWRRFLYPPTGQDTGPRHRRSYFRSVLAERGPTAFSEEALADGARQHYPQSSTRIANMGENEHRSSGLPGL